MIMPMDHAHAQRDGHGLLAVVMRMVTWDGEEPDRENKNQNADHAEQEAVHNYSTSFLVGLSGRVFCADSQETSAQGQWPGLSTEQIVLTSRAFLSFRMNKNASQETYKTYNCKKNFGSDREFSKKVTGQTYCKDSSSNSVNAFGDKFPSRIVDDRFHQLDDNMSVKRCQGGFWWNRVYSGGADMNWWFDRLTTLPWFDFRSPSRAKSEGEPTLSGLFL